MIKKIFRYRPRSDSGTPIVGQTATFSQQKDLEKKLVYKLRGKKLPRPSQLKQLPKVLSTQERMRVGVLATVIVLSLVGLGINFYVRNVIVVPTVGGQFVSGLVGAPQFINPLLSQTNDVDADITRLVFSGLLRYDQQLQLVPDIAAFWDQSEDGTTYTFTLKDGVTWHDGQPLTADDVLFTFNSIKDPDFKSPLLVSFRGVEIQKVDEHTVRFILPEAFPSFLEVLTVGIIPEHIWGNIPPANANLTEYNLKPVGSGPWQFVSLTKDKLGNIKSYTLKPHAGYHGPKPYIEQIIFKFYPNFETAVAALKNKSIEGISFLPKDLKSELAGNRNIKQYSLYLPQYTAIFFNQKQSEFLKNKEIRKALAISIDKSKILSEALRLEGEIIDGPILPVTVATDPATQLNFDPTQAKLLLQEAGWEQITKQQYLDFLTEQQATVEAAQAADEDTTENTTITPEAATTSAETVPEPTETPSTDELQELFRKNGNQILTLTLTTVNQPENVKAAELIKQAWEEVGVKVMLHIVEGNRISREVIKPRNFDVLLFGIIVGSNPDPFPFWHSSQVQDPGLNLAQLANREVDKLLEDGRMSTDAVLQQKNYQRFYNILLSEIPAIFLYNPTYTYVLDQKIKGVNIDRIISPADRFNNLQDWYIKTKKTLKTEFN